MRLRARQTHRYHHRASQVLYLFAPGEEKDVPDEVGQLLLKEHPDKFSLEGEDGIIALGPAVTVVEEAPRDTMERRRGGRRKVLPRQAGGS